MNNFNKILADHDDVYSHGTILYTDGSDVVYADKACTVVVEGETLKDIYLKGCVVATVSDGVETGSYSKPTSLEVVSDSAYKLVAGGGASSWNDLTDKPFGEYAETYYAVKWDGVIGDRVTAADRYDTFVHISDIVPTMDDINKGAVLYQSLGRLTADFFIEENGYIYEAGNMVVIVPADNFDAWDDGSLIFPKKGIYFSYDVEWGYCTTFELKDFELFEPYTRTVIAKLDEVVLPSTLPVIVQVSDADTSTGSALYSHTYEQLLDLLINGANLYVQNYGILYAPYFNPMDGDGRLVFEAISGLIPFAKRLMYISPDNSVEIVDNGYEPSIVLQSPNGTAYKITVSDTGSITVNRY